MDRSNSITSSFPNRFPATNGLERNGSVSSTSSNGTTRSNAADPFAYQTRLLERTASGRSGSSLSRASSISSVHNPLAPTVSGNRTWRPSHRVGGSIDSVRGKWEERANAAALLDGQRSESPTRGELSSNGAADLRRSPTKNYGDTYSRSAEEDARTPRQLKRQTMPAHIETTPLSPNTTGISVEGGDNVFSSFSMPSAPQRIRLPTSNSSTNVNRYATPPSPSSSGSMGPPAPLSRSRTMDMAVQDTGSSRSSDSTSISTWGLNSRSTASSNPFSVPSSPEKSSYRPPSRALSTVSSGWSESSSPEKTHFRPPSRTSLWSEPPSSPDKPSPRPPSRSSLANIGWTGSASNKQLPAEPTSTSDAPSSVMAPKPYRSTYMSGKSRKSAEYDKLSIGRRLGRHMPRIASGDGDENWVEETPEEADRRKRREARTKQKAAWDVLPKPLPPTPPTIHTQTKLHATADDVAGVPGRLRLSKDVVAPESPVSPLPSGRISRGLWADTQRQHIQAYEYLCHVGEAQQWIEGCLGEELGFGVVEMDEGLRNGVVLAKLARSIPGAPPLRRIYDAPKLDYRHTDNINYFVEFIRDGLGLPEYFMFELTDLYDKKNIPKVIYCIHALSHLLVRRGLAARMGNLIGRLEFSDDQLRTTQKGLKDAGVAMPNFGNVGKELAKEINEDPEVEIETEEERQDRELQENKPYIIALQAQARQALARRARARDRITAEHRAKFVQAQCRGVLIRRRAQRQRQQQHDATPWVVAIQACIRARLVRRKWLQRLQSLKATTRYIVKIQAQSRGLLQRRRYLSLRRALGRVHKSIVSLQSRSRGKLLRVAQQESVKTFSDIPTMHSIVALQAEFRSYLVRRQLTRFDKAVGPHIKAFVKLQAQVRGALTRRRMRAQMARLGDVSHVVVRIQAAARTFLARKRLLILIRRLRQVTPMVIGFQARARANLMRQQHQKVNKALTHVKVISSLGGLQARARAALIRNRQREQEKKLDFVAPDVVGFQAHARGYLVFRDYCAWRDHIWRNEPTATILQAMLRGVLQRRQFKAKIDYYRENLHKVVKIQALFRAKECREQYRQLTVGQNVTVGTIKNFVHLLDDSDADFQEEIKVERLRKQVVEKIRENQILESVVSDLDVKIALVVQNVKSFEELVKAKRLYGAENAAVHASRAILAAHGDPFAGSSALDHDTKRRLELYKQLFYLLQTQPEYLSKYFLIMSRDDTLEKDRRFFERVVLTLFGFGQDRREDYLLLKLFQLTIREEISRSSTIDAIIRGHPMYISIAVRYARPKQVTYIRETLQKNIRDIVASDGLDLEVDPVKIYRRVVDLEEMRSGQANAFPRDVTFEQALHHPEARAIYIDHLQLLQVWTDTFLQGIILSTKRLPYGIRYLARETLLHLTARFSDAPEAVCAACIGRLVFYRYINPAIITPETFEIVENTIDIEARKNLGQVSKILTQISSGTLFGVDNKAYMPLNKYIEIASQQLLAWFLEVADVPDAETHFHAHEFLDATIQPKPILISPNEIYTIHTLLAQHQALISSHHNDTLRVILTELGGVPNLGNEELKEARDQAITLELTNRFANVQDPRADEKALWVQAKRGVLAVLRVQPAQDLLEALIQPVTDDDEDKWEAILEAEILNQNTRPTDRRMASTAGGEAYRLEDIRSMSFQQVKAGALEFLLELEKRGMITRKDSFQGILNAIASDVRSKHRKRIQRQQEMASMKGALKHLQERKKDFEEQIESYHSYADAAMQTMQKSKGKKTRVVLPFTKQYFHLRDLQKAGKTPQFGSFKYTAKSWYEKKILLSLETYSPRQFDKIDFVISSNQPGVFTVEVFNNTLGITNRIASQDLRMEDLLQEQFENQASLTLFNGIAKVNLRLFLYQINKKFYV